MTTDSISSNGNTIEFSHIVACPICKSHLLASRCHTCKLEFCDTDFGIGSYICKEMYASESAFLHARKVIDFWGNGWGKRLAEPEHAFAYELDKAALRAYADRLLTRNRAENSLISRVKNLRRGSTIALNIGCGAGTESLLLVEAGASYCIGMDITAPAAQAAELLIRKVGRGVGIQADARFIPLLDSSVDVVYSSGVLHHSEDITKSISEVFRVLKPGGTAYVMLYATWSIMFLQEKLLRLSGESAWETNGLTNPLTTTYTVAECRRMFSAFHTVQVEKNGGRASHVAKIGKYLPRFLDKVLDKPFGPTLNILATKGVDDRASLRPPGTQLSPGTK